MFFFREVVVDVVVVVFYVDVEVLDEIVVVPDEAAPPAPPAPGFPARTEPPPVNVDSKDDENFCSKELNSQQNHLLDTDSFSGFSLRHSRNFKLICL